MRELGLEGDVQWVYIGVSELSEFSMGGQKFRQKRNFEPEDPRLEE
jgi:hypothetical protein